MTKQEILNLLRQGTKIKDVVKRSGLSRSKICEMKKDTGIKVFVPRGKDKSKMFVNSNGKLDYKSKYKEFNVSEYYGF